MINNIINKFTLQPNTEIIYTDGSKIKGGKSVGAGIYLEKSQLAFGISMSTICSIFTAELVAIQAALWYSRNLEHKQDIIIIQIRSQLLRL